MYLWLTHERLWILSGVLFFISMLLMKRGYRNYFAQMINNRVRREQKLPPISPYLPVLLRFTWCSALAIGVITCLPMGILFVPDGTSPSPDMSYMFHGAQVLFAVLLSIGIGGAAGMVLGTLKLDENLRTLQPAGTLRYRTSIASLCLLLTTGFVCYGNWHLGKLHSEFKMEEATIQSLTKLPGAPLQLVLKEYPEEKLHVYFFSDSLEVGKTVKIVKINEPGTEKTVLRLLRR